MSDVVCNSVRWVADDRAIHFATDDDLRCTDVSLHFPALRYRHLALRLHIPYYRTGNRDGAHRVDLTLNPHVHADERW